MNDIRRAFSQSGFSMRWMTRLLSLVISGLFLLITLLAVTNEDKPQWPGIAILALLALTSAACLAAWRWERIGGMLAVIGALSLSVATYLASLTFGLGALSFLPALIYGVPFLVVGILFWICGQRAIS